MRNRLLLMFAAVVLFASVTFGQTSQTPAPNAEPIRPGDGDPIRQLNLTPEQREQIRAIRQNNQNERAATGQKLREANRALQLEAATFDILPALCWALWVHKVCCNDLL